MFHGNKNHQDKNLLIDEIDEKKDSAFILMMTTAVLLVLAVFFLGIACLVRMKSGLIEHESKAFYEALESERNMIQAEWQNETY